MIDDIKNGPSDIVNVAIVGKYVQLEDSYISVTESVKHAGYKNDVKVDIKLIDCEKITKENVADMLKDINAVIVHGSFGELGTDGKIEVIRYVRENKIPFLRNMFRNASGGN